MGQLRSLSPAEMEEVRKLARAICNESDAAIVELGLATHEMLIPFDRLDDDARAIYEKLAQRLYMRLVYDGTVGVLRVEDNPRLYELIRRAD